MDPQHEPFDMAAITVIEFHMMDKRKYFPLTALSGFTIRTILYPFSLIKTRLQLQRNHTAYTSLFDAFGKIVGNEGFRGLYRGFWISNLMMVSQVSYIGTYEMVRNYLAENTTMTNNKIRSFIAGGCASIVGQTTIVPIDIVSQHLQMLGARWHSTSSTTASNSVKKHTLKRPVHALEIPQEALRSKVGAAKAIVILVYRRDGLRGFYRGYFASLATYAPSSALWWFFYDIYCTVLGAYAPVWIPRLMLQCMAAPMGGATTTFLTTPMDAIRARIQVENTKFVETARNLWAEEQFGIFVKGLSARLVQSLFFSFFIILGYETIKRWSLLEQYKGSVRW